MRAADDCPLLRAYQRRASAALRAREQRREVRRLRGLCGDSLSRGRRWAERRRTRQRKRRSMAAPAGRLTLRARRWWRQRQQETWQRWGMSGRCWRQRLQRGQRLQRRQREHEPNSVVAGMSAPRSASAPPAAPASSENPAAMPARASPAGRSRRESLGMSKRRRSHHSAMPSPATDTHSSPARERVSGQRCGGARLPHEQRGTGTRGRMHACTHGRTNVGIGPLHSRHALRVRVLQRRGHRGAGGGANVKQACNGSAGGSSGGSGGAVTLAVVE